MSPVRQSNAISDLHVAIYGRQAAVTNEGGFPEDSLFLFFEVFDITYTMYTQIGARLSTDAHPSGDTMAHVIVCSEMDMLPRDFVGSKTAYVLQAAVVVGANHAVTALLDAGGEPNVILDPNGNVFQQSWWPVLNVVDIVDGDVGVIIAVYTSKEFANARRVRCRTTLPPVLQSNTAACAARVERLASVSLQIGNILGFAAPS